MDIGKISESKVLYALTNLGWTASIPFSDSSKYDLISESNEGLKRIQVKTASFKPSRKMQGSKPTIRLYTANHKYTSSDIDIFIGVYGDQVLVFDEIGEKNSVSIAKMKPIYEHPLFIKS